LGRGQRGHKTRTGNWSGGDTSAISRPLAKGAKQARPLADEAEALRHHGDPGAMPTPESCGGILMRPERCARDLPGVGREAPGRCGAKKVHRVRCAEAPRNRRQTGGDQKAQPIMVSSCSGRWSGPAAGKSPGAQSTAKHRGLTRRYGAADVMPRLAHGWEMPDRRSSNKRGDGNRGQR